MKEVSIVLLLGFSSLFVSAQSKEEIAVANAVEQLRKAMVDADKVMLEKLTSNDLSYGHSSGKVEDKVAFIENLVNGTFDFVSIDLTDQTIKITDRTAIVRHTLQGATNDKGKPPGTVRLFVLLIWQKQDGDWKLLARQAVRLQT